MTILRAAPWRAALGERRRGHAPAGGRGGRRRCCWSAAPRGRRQPPTTHGSARFAARRDLADLASAPRPRWPAPARSRRRAAGRGAAAGPDGAAGRCTCRRPIAERHVLHRRPARRRQDADRSSCPTAPPSATHSFVVTDPKCEAWRLTGGLHARGRPLRPGASRTPPPASTGSRPAPTTGGGAAGRGGDAAGRGPRRSSSGDRARWCCARRCSPTRPGRPSPTPATVYALLEAPDLFGLLARSAAHAGAAGGAGARPGPTARCGRLSYSTCRTA